MVSYFGSYIAVSSFKILQVILCIQLVQNFNLRCPVQSEWDVVARRRCNSIDNYVCLFDENSFIYGNTCSPRPHFEPSGYKSILLGGITRKECSSQLYQPFIFWTNGSSECTYQKSLCTEKGQVLYGNGTTKTDRTCHCDYTRNYAFTREPQNKCFCVPSEEDCSCSIKDCPVGHLLTPDYECVSVTNWKPSFNCKQIDEPMDKHSSVNYKDNTTTVGYNNISEAYGISKTEVSVIIILSLLVMLLFLLDLLLENKLYGFILDRRSLILARLQNPGESVLSAENFSAEEKVDQKDEKSTSVIRNENSSNATQVFKSKDDQNKDWERLKENQKYFIETTAACKVLETLKEKQFIVIIGPPGSGKSAIMCYACLKLEQDLHYTICLVSNPSDVRNQFSKDSKQLFVFENAFGVHELDESKLKRWKEEEEYIKSIIIDNADIKIILTCRSYIYRRNSFKTLSFSPEVLNLLSNTLKLQTHERKEISKSYLGHSISEKLSEEVINMYNFFPLICFAFSQTTEVNTKSIQDFFTNPYTLLKPEINELKRKNDVAYLVIALLVVLNNRIEKRMLELDNNDLEQIVNDLFNESELKSMPSKTLMKSNLYALVGTYLKDLDNGYEFLHHQLFVNIACCIGGHFIFTILKHGDSTFILDRLRFASLYGQQLELSVFVKLEQENAFFNRLLLDLKKHKNRFVFLNPQMQKSIYRKKLAQFMISRQLKRTSMSVDADGTTLLHAVCWYGDEKLVQFVIDLNKKIIHTKTQNGRTPLHFACETGNVEVVPTLLHAKAEIDAIDSNNCTPLVLACEHGNHEIAEALLQKGANVNRKRNDNKTVMHIACEQNDIRFVQLFLNHKADVNCQDSQLFTPLHIACFNKNLDIVKVLLRSDSLEFKRDSKDRKPLHIACELNLNHIVEELLKHEKASPDSKTTGRYPLHITCQKGFGGLTQCLISHGAKVNNKDEDGSVPLHLACRENKLDVVKILLENKAKVYKKNNKKETPLTIAQSGNYTDIVNVLLAYNAK